MVLNFNEKNYILNNLGSEIMKFNKIGQKIKKKLNDSKGMALIATLIFTLVISTLGIALLTMTNNDTKLTTLEKESSEAFYLADSGINRAINYLERAATPPIASVIGINDTLNGTKWIDSEGNKYDLGASLNLGKYYKIEMTLQTGIGSTRAYKIISTGKLVGPNRNATRVIEQLVDVTNFAEYAYFSNNEGDNIWFYDGDTIDGRLHTNGQLRIDGRPTFKGLVTSATEPIIWGGGDKHEEIFDAYGFRLGVDEYIPLPEKTGDISGTENPLSLESIAMGSWTPPTPPGNGVYIPNDGGDNRTGGIYVNGNLDALSLTTENGLSVMEFNQGGTHGTNTKITLLPAGSVDPYDFTTVTSDKTVIKEEGTVDPPIYYNGLTNGLLYVNGEIKSLKATEATGGLQGKMTIAATDDITITNDIKYKSIIDNPLIDIHDDGVDLSPITDTLGLISEKDIVLDTSNSITDLEIHATLMALGDSIRNQDYNLSSYYKDTGILTIFGGLIQMKRGPVGTFNSGTNEIITGYDKDYNFDERMTNPILDAIPPYFPTTGNYEPIYWMESNG